MPFNLEDLGPALPKQARKPPVPTVSPVVTPTTTKAETEPEVKKPIEVLPGEDFSRYILKHGSSGRPDLRVKPVSEGQVEWKTPDGTRRRAEAYVVNPETGEPLEGEPINGAPVGLLLRGKEHPTLLKGVYQGGEINLKTTDKGTPLDSLAMQMLGTGGMMFANAINFVTPYANPLEGFADASERLTEEGRKAQGYAVQNRQAIDPEQMHPDLLPGQVAAGLGSLLPVGVIAGGINQFINRLKFARAERRVANLINRGDVHAANKLQTRADEMAVQGYGSGGAGSFGALFTTVGGMTEADLRKENINDPTGGVFSGTISGFAAYALLKKAGLWQFGSRQEATSEFFDNVGEYTDKLIHDSQHLPTAAEVMNATFIGAIVGGIFPVEPGGGLTAGGQRRLTRLLMDKEAKREKAIEQAVQDVITELGGNQPAADGGPENQVDPTVVKTVKKMASEQQTFEQDDETIDGMTIPEFNETAGEDFAPELPLTERKVLFKNLRVMLRENAEAKEVDIHAAGILVDTLPPGLVEGLGQGLGVLGSQPDDAPYEKRVENVQKTVEKLGGLPQFLELLSRYRATRLAAALGNTRAALTPEALPYPTPEEERGLGPVYDAAGLALSTLPETELSKLPQGEIADIYTQYEQLLAEDKEKATALGLDRLGQTQVPEGDVATSLAQLKETLAAYGPEEKPAEPEIDLADVAGGTSQLKETVQEVQQTAPVLPGTDNDAQLWGEQVKVGQEGDVESQPWTKRTLLRNTAITQAAKLVNALVAEQLANTGAFTKNARESGKAFEEELQGNLATSYPEALEVLEAYQKTIRPDYEGQQNLAQRAIGLAAVWAYPAYLKALKNEVEGKPAAAPAPAQPEAEAEKKPIGTYTTKVREHGDSGFLTLEVNRNGVRHPNLFSIKQTGSIEEADISDGHKVTITEFDDRGKVADYVYETIPEALAGLEAELVKREEAEGFEEPIVAVEEGDEPIGTYTAKLAPRDYLGKANVIVRRNGEMHPNTFSFTDYRKPSEFGEEGGDEVAIWEETPEGEEVEEHVDTSIPGLLKTLKNNLVEREENERIAAKRQAREEAKKKAEEAAQPKPEPEPEPKPEPEPEPEPAPTDPVKPAPLPEGETARQTVPPVEAPVQEQPVTPIEEPKPAGPDPSGVGGLASSLRGEKTRQRIDSVTGWWKELSARAKERSEKRKAAKKVAQELREADKKKKAEAKAAKKQADEEAKAKAKQDEEAAKAEQEEAKKKEEAEAKAKQEKAEAAKPEAEGKSKSALELESEILESGTANKFRQTIRTLFGGQQFGHSDFQNENFAEEQIGWVDENVPTAPLPGNTEPVNYGKNLTKALYRAAIVARQTSLGITGSALGRLDLGQRRDSISAMLSKAQVADLNTKHTNIVTDQITGYLPSHLAGAVARLMLGEQFTMVIGGGGIAEAYASRPVAISAGNASEGAKLPITGASALSAAEVHKHPGGLSSMYEHETGRFSGAFINISGLPPGEKGIAQTKNYKAGMRLRAAPVQVVVIATPDQIKDGMVEQLLSENTWHQVAELEPSPEQGIVWEHSKPESRLLVYNLNAVPDKNLHYLPENAGTIGNLSDIVFGLHATLENDEGTKRRKAQFRVLEFMHKKSKSTGTLYARTTKAIAAEMLGTPEKGGDVAAYDARVKEIYEAVREMVSRDLLKAPGFHSGTTTLPDNEVVELGIQGYIQYAILTGIAPPEALGEGAAGLEHDIFPLDITTSVARQLESLIPKQYQQSRAYAGKIAKLLFNSIETRKEVFYNLRLTADQLHNIISRERGYSQEIINYIQQRTTQFSDDIGIDTAIRLKGETEGQVAAYHLVGMLGHMLYPYVNEQHQQGLPISLADLIKQTGGKIIVSTASLGANHLYDDHYRNSGQLSRLAHRPATTWQERLKMDRQLAKRLTDYGSPADGDKYKLWEMIQGHPIHVNMYAAQQYGLVKEVKDLDDEVQVRERKEFSTYLSKNSNTTADYNRYYIYEVDLNKMAEWVDEKELMKAVRDYEPIHQRGFKEHSVEMIFKRDDNNIPLIYQDEGVKSKIEADVKETFAEVANGYREALSFQNGIRELISAATAKADARRAAAPDGMTDEQYDVHLINIIARDFVDFLGYQKKYSKYTDAQIGEIDRRKIQGEILRIESAYEAGVGLLPGIAVHDYVQKSFDHFAKHFGWDPKALQRMLNTQAEWMFPTAMPWFLDHEGGGIALKEHVYVNPANDAPVNLYEQGMEQGLPHEQIAANIHQGFEKLGLNVGLTVDTSRDKKNLIQAQSARETLRDYARLLQSIETIARVLGLEQLSNGSTTVQIFDRSDEEGVLGVLKASGKVIGLANFPRGGTLPHEFGHLFDRNLGKGSDAAKAWRDALYLSLMLKLNADGMIEAVRNSYRKLLRDEDTDVLDTRGTKPAQAERLRAIVKFLTKLKEQGPAALTAEDMDVLYTFNVPVSEFFDTSFAIQKSSQGEDYMPESIRSDSGLAGYRDKISELQEFGNYRKNYLFTPLELLARAFDHYIARKLLESGITDTLTSGIRASMMRNAYVQAFNGDQYTQYYPLPTGSSDYDRIYHAMDSFWSNVIEQDGNLALRDPEISPATMFFNDSDLTKLNDLAQELSAEADAIDNSFGNKQVKKDDDDVDLFAPNQSFESTAPLTLELSAQQAQVTVAGSDNHYSPNPNEYPQHPINVIVRTISKTQAYLNQAFAAAGDLKFPLSMKYEQQKIGRIPISDVQAAIIRRAQNVLSKVRYYSVSLIPLLAPSSRMDKDAFRYGYQQLENTIINDSKAIPAKDHTPALFEGTYASGAAALDKRLPPSIYRKPGFRLNRLPYNKIYSIFAGTGFGKTRTAIGLAYQWFYDDSHASQTAITIVPKQSLANQASEDADSMGMPTVSWVTRTLLDDYMSRNEGMDFDAKVFAEVVENFSKETKIGQHEIQEALQWAAGDIAAPAAAISEDEELLNKTVDDKGNKLDTWMLHNDPKELDAIKNVETQSRFLRAALDSGYKWAPKPKGYKSQLFIISAYNRTEHHANIPRRDVFTVRPKRDKTLALLNKRRMMFVTYDQLSNFNRKSRVVKKEDRVGDYEGAVPNEDDRLSSAEEIVSANELTQWLKALSNAGDPLVIFDEAHNIASLAKFLTFPRQRGGLKRHDKKAFLEQYPGVEFDATGTRSIFTWFILAALNQAKIVTMSATPVKKREEWAPFGSLVEGGTDVLGNMEKGYADPMTPLTSVDAISDNTSAGEIARTLVDKNSIAVEFDHTGYKIQTPIKIKPDQKDSEALQSTMKKMVEIYSEWMRAILALHAKKTYTINREKGGKPIEVKGADLAAILASDIPSKFGGGNLQIQEYFNTSLKVKEMLRQVREHIAQGHKVAINVANVYKEAFEAQWIKNGKPSPEEQSKLVVNPVGKVPTLWDPVLRVIESMLSDIEMALPGDEITLNITNEADLEEDQGKMSAEIRRGLKLKRKTSAALERLRPRLLQNLYDHLNNLPGDIGINTVMGALVDEFGEDMVANTTSAIDVRRLDPNSPQVVVRKTKLAGLREFQRGHIDEHGSPIDEIGDVGNQLAGVHEKIFNPEKMSPEEAQKYADVIQAAKKAGKSRKKRKKEAPLIIHMSPASAGTGVNIHNIDGRKRVHMIVNVSKNPIDTVQTMGRFNRSGQIEVPDHKIFVIEDDIIDLRLGGDAVQKVGELFGSVSGDLRDTSGLHNFANEYQLVLGKEMDAIVKELFTTYLPSLFVPADEVTSSPEASEKREALLKKVREEYSLDGYASLEDLANVLGLYNPIREKISDVSEAVTILNRLMILDKPERDGFIKLIQAVELTREALAERSTEIEQADMDNIKKHTSRELGKDIHGNKYRMETIQADKTIEPRDTDNFFAALNPTDVAYYEEGKGLTMISVQNGLGTWWLERKEVEVIKTKKSKRGRGEGKREKEMQTTYFLMVMKGNEIRKVDVTTHIAYHKNETDADEKSLDNEFLSNMVQVFDFVPWGLSYVKEFYGLLSLTSGIDGYDIGLEALREVLSKKSGGPLIMPKGEKYIRLHRSSSNRAIVNYAQIHNISASIVNIPSTLNANQTIVPASAHANTLKALKAIRDNPDKLKAHAEKFADQSQRKIARTITDISNFTDVYTRFRDVGKDLALSLREEFLMNEKNSEAATDYKKGHPQWANMDAENFYTPPNDDAEFPLKIQELGIELSKLTRELLETMDTFIEGGIRGELASSFFEALGVKDLDTFARMITAKKDGKFYFKDYYRDKEYINVPFANTPFALLSMPSFLRNRNQHNVPETYFTSMVQSDSDAVQRFKKLESNLKQAQRHLERDRGVYENHLKMMLEASIAYFDKEKDKASIDDNVAQAMFQEHIANFKDSIDAKPVEGRNEQKKLYNKHHNQRITVRKNVVLMGGDNMPKVIDGVVDSLSKLKMTEKVRALKYPQMGTKNPVPGIVIPLEMIGKGTFDFDETSVTYEGDVRLNANLSDLMDKVAESESGAVKLSNGIVVYSRLKMAQHALRALKVGGEYKKIWDKAGLSPHKIEAEIDRINNEQIIEGVNPMKTIGVFAMESNIQRAHGKDDTHSMVNKYNFIQTDYHSGTHGPDLDKYPIDIVIQLILKESIGDNFSKKVYDSSRKHWTEKIALNQVYRSESANPYLKLLEESTGIEALTPDEVLIEMFPLLKGEQSDS